eukprot:gene31102-37587_t
MAMLYLALPVLVASASLTPEMPDVLPRKAIPINPNDNEHLTDSGVVQTVFINMGVCIILLMIFEYNRFFKQIYLKRLQNRFRIAERVPEYPPEYAFGWFVEIQKISETEFLKMVGLDAFMCLRFIYICLKLAMFLTFWGMLILLPVYSTAFDYEDWERYEISNLMKGGKAMRKRLWVSAFFGYIYAIYFCQLLYMEYNNFSVSRLQYLVQADADDSKLDPDTPPQKYFTVMIEHIPAHLRSAQALYKFFDKLFPNEVYAVEISLDIAELDAMNYKRKRLRAKLEHAIAHYEAKNERPLVYAKANPGYSYTDDEDGIFGEDGLTQFLFKQFSYEKMGYVQVDAIHYYSHKLKKYNDQVRELQKKYCERAEQEDASLMQKFTSGSDTRLATVFDAMGRGVTTGSGKSSSGDGRATGAAVAAGTSTAGAAGAAKVYGGGSLGTIVHSAAGAPGGSSATHPAGGKAKKASGVFDFSFDSFLFGDEGKKGMTLETALTRETEKLEQIIAYEAQEAKRRMSEAPALIDSGSGAIPRERTRVQRASVLATSDEVHVHHGGQGEAGPKTTRPFSNPTLPVPSEKDPPPPPNPFEGNTDIAFVEPPPNPFYQSTPSRNPSLVTHSTTLPSRNPSLATPAISAKLPSSRNPSFATPAYAPNVSASPSLSLLETDPTLREWIKKRDSFVASEPEGVVAPSARRRDRGYSELSGASSHGDVVEMRDTSIAVASHTPFNYGSSRAPSRDPSLYVSGTTGGSPTSYMHSLFGEPGAGIGVAEGARRSSRNYHYDEEEGRVEGVEDKHEKAVRLLREDSAGEEWHDRSEVENPTLQSMPVHRPSLTSATETGGVSTVLPPIANLTQDQLNELTLLSIEKVKLTTQQGWLQTKLAGRGAVRGLVEIERAIEMVMLGAYYKYSSTAFVTFTNRVSESIAKQLLLSHDNMEVSSAPNPHDIIWDNVAIPKSQIALRKSITNAGVIVGSIFWSSLVNDVNALASIFPLPPQQQQLMSAVVMLIFLLILPFIFDYIARNYEGLKRESEIQNSIMTRYFYYQLINIYVTVGFSSNNLWAQLIKVLQQPQTLVEIMGGRVPDVTKFMFNLVIVKVFTAIPLEMIRPWQLITIHLMSHCMDRRKSTRRDLRSGLFYSWPMLYGWIYPQLMMVLMIMVTYSSISPLLMPPCILFFMGAYIMYKYQLLYVYINDYQSGGFMWYAVFTRSVVALMFGSLTLLGYLALQLSNPYLAGIAQRFFVVHLNYLLNLSYGFARELDQRNAERKKAGKSVPQDTFTKLCYRQP